MTMSLKADVTAQVQKYWSAKFTQELRESLLLGALVNKDYEGEIKKGGDTVYVSQVNAPVGETLSTEDGSASTFGSQKISTTRVAIQANKRFVASYEFEDIVDLQSQIDIQGSEAREALLFAMQQQINDYLYSMVAPSTSNPDHSLASVTDMNKAQVLAIRTLAAQAKWSKAKGWYALLDPSYYGDVLNDTVLGSSDYGATDAPTISGQIALPRFGFNILEDNSSPVDYGLFFHPDFLHFVSQQSVRVKISDLHSNHQFGVLMSVDLVGGAALGIAGNVKHVLAYNTNATHD